MRLKFPINLLSFSILFGPALAAPSPTELVTSFEENRGQFPSQVRFVHRNPKVGLSVLADGTIRLAAQGWTGALQLQPVREGRAVESLGVQPLAAKANVFVGSARQRWISGIPLFGKVAVRSFGDGLDLELSSDGMQIRLELHAAPEIDLSQLRWTLDGVDLGSIAAAAVVPFDGGSLRLSKASETFDSSGGNASWIATLDVATTERTDVEGGATDVRLALAENGSVYVGGSVDRGRGVRDAFVVKLRDDRSTLEWVAYLGGEGDSEVSGIAVTAGGDPVVTGRTSAGDFPSVRPIQPAAGGGLDAFVTRVASDGSRLSFSTLLGGEGRDSAEGIARDAGGVVRITGYTSSAADGGDAFVATIDTEEAVVRSSTTLDRGSIESGRAIVVDRDGNAWLAGVSQSAGTSRPFVARVDGHDHGVSKLAEIDDVREGEATSIALDAGGEIWIGGWRRDQGGSRTPLLAALRPQEAVRVVATHPADSATSIAAIAAGPAGELWLVEETETGPVLSRRSPRRSPDAEQVVSPAPGFARVGGIVRSHDGTVLVAGSAQEGGSGILVGPIGEGGSALLAAVAAGSGAPLAGCPGTINFDNSSGTGLWQTATNWDLDRLPVSTDDVCIGVGFAVTLSSGAQSAGTLYTGAGSSLGITLGTLSIVGPSQVTGTLALSGGTLTGTGSVTVSGLTSWTGGSMTGAGATNTGGGLSISGAGTKDLAGSRVLNATGNTTLSGTGGVRVGTGAAINNTGIWDCQNDATFVLLSGAASFNNNASGTFRKSAGTGTANFGITFNNASAVEILAGTVSLNTGGTHSGSFAGSPGATLRIGGGTHTFGATSSINAESVLFAGGTVGFDGTYLATSATTVPGSTVNFNAASTISGVGSTLTISGGDVNLNTGDPINLLSLNFSAGTLGGTDTVTVSGLTTWTGGAMNGAGTTTTDGGLSLGGTSTKDVANSRVLNATGDTTWAGSGGLRVGTGAAIHNTGTWDCQSDSSIALLSGSPVFYNDAPGIFRKSAGAGTTSVGIAFDNASVVEIQAGTLSLNAGGTHGGSFVGSPGAALRIGGGTQTFGAASSINAETVLFAGGTVGFDGTYAATGATTASGSTVNFNPASTISGIGGGLAISAGVVNFSSGDPIDLLTLNFSAGTLGGTDTVTVSGLTTWTGGAMNGAGITNTDGGLSIGGSATKDLANSRVLNATGNTTWAGLGGLRVGSGATVHNTGTWDCQSDTSVALLSGSPVFYNDAPGIFRKSAGAGTTSVGIAFDNASAVEIQAGTLSLNAGGTHSGSFVGSPGATLRIGGGTQAFGAASSINAESVLFAGGTVGFDGTYAATSATTASGSTVNFNAASTISGLGSSLAISAGVVNFNSGEPVNPATLTLSATLGGTDTVTVSGLTTWTSGAMNGAGITNTDGGLSLGGTSTKDVANSRVLNATGNTTWTGTGGVRVGSGAVINNTGLWDCQSDAAFVTLSGAAGFNNNASGTFKKSAGSGTTSVALSFSTSGNVEAFSGTLSFPNGYPQTSGSTTQNGGVITSPTPLSISGGLLQGLGTIAAGVSSSGRVGPGLSPGILGVAGSYSQAAAGSLAVEIGGVTPGAEHDRLDVAGPATLAGTLDVTLVNGFDPSPGDEFTILTCASRGGTFASTLLPSLPPGRQWRVDYFDTAVKLVVLSVPAGRVPGDLSAESLLTAAKSGADITLSWAQTCVPTDTDFAVYEGVLGNYTSHVPVLCSTGGAPTATFTPGTGSRYFLVAAHNGGEEGSYGYDSNQVERALSAAGCHPRNIAACP